MEFNLERDIVFFDIESTGLNVIKDRILQIALIKYFADDRPVEELTLLINPGIPISPEAQAVHGISAQDVANKPTFAQVAEQIHQFIGPADIGGYNSNRFDLPLLMEEFNRVGLEFSKHGRRSIDVQKIFYKMEPRTLKAALKFYCGKELVGAHDALADVRATVDVLKGQLDRYKGKDTVDGDNNVIKEPVRNDMQVLHDLCNDNTLVDATQRLKRTGDGTIVFNFGKNVGKPVGETLYHDKQYYNWIMNKEFSSEVKQLVTRLLKEYEATKNPMA